MLCMMLENRILEKRSPATNFQFVLICFSILIPSYCPLLASALFVEHVSLLFIYLCAVISVFHTLPVTSSI